jgi:hypothetical protein
MGADGTMSPLSRVSAVALTSGQDALDIVVQGWPATATGYFAFAGLDPSLLTYQQSAVALPSTVKYAGPYNVGSWGAPDQAFSSLRANVNIEVHAGIVGTSVEAVTTSSITVPVFNDYGFVPHQLVGREVVVLGIQGSDLTEPTYVPIANFEISDNNANTLDLSSGDPTTCVYGNSLQFGDALCIRMLPTFGEDSTGFYFEDDLWVNCLNEVDVEYPVTGVSISSGVATLSIENVGGTFPFSNGQVVVVQNILGVTGASGAFVVGSANSSAWTFQLVGSSCSGTYTSGGWAAVQPQGLATNGEVGNIAFIINGTGKGTWAKIGSNTATRCYIVGAWPVTPDSSSRIVILDSNINVVALSQAINNDEPGLVESYDIDVSNYSRAALFVRVSSVSPNGLVSSPQLDPFREIFLFGSQFPRTISADATMLPTDSMVNGNANAGAITYTCLPFSQIQGRLFTLSKVDGSPNTVTLQTASSNDTFEDGSTSVALSVHGDSITWRIQSG